MPNETMSNKVYIGAQVEEELRQTIRVEAAKLGKTMAQALREALDLWLAQVSDNGAEQA